MAFYPQYGYQSPYYPQPVQDQMAQMRQNQWSLQNPQQPPAQAAPQPQQGSGIIWVQGEEGAKAYMVAPGTTVLLMDSDGSSFYLKSADISGMPQPLRIFDYNERTAAQKQPAQAVQQPVVEYVSREEFEALKATVSGLTAKEPSKGRKIAKKDADNG